MRFQNWCCRMLRERFRDKILTIRIQLHVQNGVHTLVRLGGLTPVLGSGFEHWYLITCSNGGSKCGGTDRVVPSTWYLVASSSTCQTAKIVVFGGMLNLVLKQRYIDIE